MFRQLTVVISYHIYALKQGLKEYRSSIDEENTLEDIIHRLDMIINKLNLSIFMIKRKFVFHRL